MQIADKNSGDKTERIGNTRTRSYNPTRSLAIHTNDLPYLARVLRNIQSPVTSACGNNGRGFALNHIGKLAGGYGAPCKYKRIR